MKRTLVRGCFVVLAVLVFGCNGDDDSPPPIDDPGPSEAKPTFDWGYPDYSKYVDGKHVGKTLYQTDPTCQTRLTFYTCDFIDADTPDTPLTNPTMASGAMTGGLDSCTAAISAEAPSYCIPADVCNPSKQAAAWAPGQASADNLAWQLFIALNWPADSAEPGYPDTTAKLGDEAASGGGHAEAVWLDYPTLEALFGVPSPCEGPTLTMNSKLSDNFLSKEPRLEAIDGLGTVGDTEEAFGGVLVDQNTNVAYFDVRVNRTEWEFIVNQNDYWMTGASLDAIKPNLMRDYSVPPGQTAGAFPAALVATETAPGDIGANEIKSAWKQLTDDEVAGGTYYTRRFNLFDPDAPVGQQCTPKMMGLIGMHILYMPAIFGNPEWVWATFEHRLNVPTSGINDGETQFSFYDADCPMTKTPAECAAYNSQTDSPEDFRCCPNAELYPTQPGPGTLVPSQVTRLVDPTASTILPTDCTGHYLNAITTHFGADNVFKNYFLVSTQWPLRGSSTNFPFYDPGVIANFPCTMRNSTMETFAVDPSPPTMHGCSANTENPFCRQCNGDCVKTAAEAAVPCPGGQEPPSPTQFETADCMGCHGAYAPHNSSFIFSHRPCCVRKDGDLPNDCGDFLQQNTCAAVSTCEWVSSDPSCS
jgi:hypothetical protein